VSGRPGNATVTPDSVGLDSTEVQAGDTSTMGQETSPTSTPQDTLGPRDTGAGAGDTTGMTGDTTGFQGDTSGMTGDTTSTDTTSTNQ
jgi:hypothetical protein